MTKNIRKAIAELIETRTDEIDNYLFQQRKDIKDLTLQIISLQNNTKEGLIGINDFIDELEHKNKNNALTFLNFLYNRIRNKN